MILFKTHSEHELRRIRKTLNEIEKLRPAMLKLTDKQLQDKTKEFKKRLTKETLEDLLPEAFAVIREADRRVLGMEPLILCQEKVQIKNDFFPSCQHT